MSRGRAKQLGLILAVALRARAATATEAQVTVRCPELSAEDTAQVEARVRATLLSAGLTPATVELSCELAAVQAQVTGNGHQVLQRSDRNEGSVKEALLTSADNALSAWGAAGSATAPSLPPPASETPPAVEPVPAPVRPATPPPVRAPDARPADRPSSASTWLSAGLRTELWSGGSGLGPQLGFEQKRGSVFLAAHAGYMLSLPSSSQFSAHDLQFGAQLGWQPQPLFGLRGALGVGLSLFGASPATGVSAADGSTNSTLPCLSLELSRPVEFGVLALLPAVGLRAFPSSRSVLVNGEQVLALPALALEGSLSLALKVGG